MCGDLRQEVVTEGMPVPTTCLFRPHDATTRLVPWHHRSSQPHSSAHTAVALDVPVPGSMRGGRGLLSRAEHTDACALAGSCTARVGRTLPVPDISVDLEKRQQLRACMLHDVPLADDVQARERERPRKQRRELRILRREPGQHDHELQRRHLRTTTLVPRRGCTPNGAQGILP